MKRVSSLLSLTLTSSVLALAVGACHGRRTSLVTAESLATSVPNPDRNLQRQRVMSSRFCATCHPAIYAEHEENTHGRAFSDQEVRLATGHFAHGDCIRCHTPRPIFETGIGMNPVRRHHDLEGGITCMSCHWKPGQDYGSFAGGVQCKTAFDHRVGQVEACASCHRNHGTPYQWERAPTGKAAGKTCIDCHMRRVSRPVAVGQKPRRVRSHVFPGVRNAAHVRRAYRYSVELDGNEVVVRIKNKGAGHNFPTELKQRSVESLVVVRDPKGKEVARSRMVFRDPYKRPYGLTLPVNTQIPAGQTREHRVPLRLASGTVDCELHFKTYFPIADHHPDLSRMLESKRLVFDAITPSDKDVVSAPDVSVVVPDGISVRQASAANLVDFARPPIGTVKIQIPQGSDAAAIRELIQLFQFPVPEGNRRAQARLVEIGTPAVSQLIDALGSWDNKTFKQAASVLRRIGAPAVPAVLAALERDELYVRLHARKILSTTTDPEIKAHAIRRVLAGLGSESAVDRASAAATLGALGARQHVADLRGLLGDEAPDVVRAAALSLAKLGDRAATPAILQAMRRTVWAETRRDLAFASARLGSVEGVGVLMDGLDHPDDLIRERFFELLFAVTGLHAGFDPYAPRPDRLQALSKLRAFWAKSGSSDWLRRPPFPGKRKHDQAWALVQKLGKDDREPFERLVQMHQDAVSALVLGLKYPVGFAARRARIAEALGRIGGHNAAPFLAATLRDPVLSVAAWAAWALESSQDKAVLPALERYEARLQTLAATGRLPASAGPFDVLLAQVARTRLMLGDVRSKQTLVNLLLSNDLTARRSAARALEDRFGETYDYDAAGTLAERRAAAKRWQ